jgi:hypothetical protein
MGEVTWRLGFSGKKPFLQRICPLSLGNLAGRLICQGLAYPAFRLALQVGYTP